MAPINLDKLQTEGRNPRSAKIDQISTMDICRIINEEDATVAHSVQQVLPVITAAANALSDRVRRGGRVIYVGAGTSGRLGVLDASEIPPTFSAPHSQFVALMAGGDSAIRQAQEGAEDNWDLGVDDMQKLSLDPSADTIIGIAASGRTPYVLGCLSYAKQTGCTTVGIACCIPSVMSNSGHVDFMIAPTTGAEVITGSTRMKAGSATKMVLNMLSTATMIKTGKTYGNMMVDVKPSNEKLVERSRGIIRSLCGGSTPPSDEVIEGLLKDCGGNVKLCIAVLRLNVGVKEARRRLEAAGGSLTATFAGSTTTSEDGSGVAASVSHLVCCVDGGGSKCTAVVMDRRGIVGQGTAGPCNVTTIGVEAAVSEILLSVDQALRDYYRQLGRDVLHPISAAFGAVWVGLAGYGRPQTRSHIDTRLAVNFGLRMGSTLKVTNDVDLQACAMLRSPRLETGLVIIAGTGSIAMRYHLNNSTPVATSRAGGWGPLLGDDGSGFDIGRSAIRHTLAKLEELGRDGAIDEINGRDPPSLQRRIIDSLCPQSPESSSVELLSSLLGSSTLEAPDRSWEPRRRIAEVARIVLGACPSDPVAQAIVLAAAKGLVRTVKPLLETTTNGSRAFTLILGGGLMQNYIYRATILSELARAGASFVKVELIDHPARLGAETLILQTMECGSRQTATKSRL